MLNSEKKIRALRDKTNIYSNSRVARRQTAIQNAVTVESMVWNVLSLALNAEEMHVATCLHAKIRTLIQTITEILLKVGLNTVNLHTYIDERKWKISKFTKNPPKKIK
jgi:hypothetical protein